MRRETIFVYYSVTFDELFTSKFPPPDMKKELCIYFEGSLPVSHIYYIGVL